jgi:hypothetical protein
MFYNTVLMNIFTYMFYSKEVAFETVDMKSNKEIKRYFAYN